MSNVMVQCPACTNVTLTAHCDTQQAVFPCDWRRCTDPQCGAQFDLANRRGYRRAPERTNPKGVVPLVRMFLDQNGDWRDNPLDGA